MEQAATTRRNRVFMNFKGLKEVHFPAMCSGEVVAASVGDGFNAFITSEGELFMSGDGGSNQLHSNRRNIDPLTPEKVVLETGVRVEAASLGMRFTLLVTKKDGKTGAVAFGGNDYCQLGKSQDSETPNQILIPVEGKPGVLQQVTGHLGDADMAEFLPAELKEVGVRSVNAGLHSTYVVANDGRVFACGHKGYGCTEPGVTDKNIDYWTFTERLTHVAALAWPVLHVGAEHGAVFGLTEDLRIVEWGKESGGSSGWGFDSSSKAKFLAPTLRKDFEPGSVIQLVNCNNRCYALCHYSTGDGKNSTCVYTFSLGGERRLVENSEGMEVLSYSLALKEGIVYELHGEGYKPSTTLIAPEGQTVVAVANGRCGRPVIITSPIENLFF